MLTDEPQPARESNPAYGCRPAYPMTRPPTLLVSVTVPGYSSVYTLADAVELVIAIDEVHSEAIQQLIIEMINPVR